MNSIEEQFQNINWKNQDAIIDFYESNLLYFNNYQQIEDSDKVSKFIDIKLHYANSLFDNSRFDKATEVLEQVSELLAKLEHDHWNYEKSERHKRFLTGLILGKQKQLKKAYPIFKKLVKEDPEHYYYKVWYDYCRIGQYYWIFGGLSYGGLSLILLDWVFELDKKLPIDTGIVGILLICIGFIAQKGVSLYYKKRKATNNR